MKAVNFGCGLNVAADWVNFDASPTLRLQRLPLVGRVARALIRPPFPNLASFGDIVRGLPLSPDSVDLAYSSHVLEHLSLRDFRQALAEVLRILKPGGVFRGVLPDLEVEARTYLADLADDACSRFMQRTYLGVCDRQRGLSGLLREDHRQQPASLDVGLQGAAVGVAGNRVC